MTEEERAFSAEMADIMNAFNEIAGGRDGDAVMAALGEMLAWGFVEACEADLEQISKMMVQFIEGMGEAIGRRAAEYRKEREN